MVTQKGYSPKGRVRTHRGKEYTVSPAHPIADKYHWPSPDELDALAASIKSLGLKQKIGVAAQ